MIITRTPFRISFFGGGTDYPEYFEKHGGAVLATTVEQSAYLSVMRFYSHLFDYCIRIAYRKVECVKSLDDIRHTPFQECLRRTGVSSDVEVNYSADLPSSTGMGTSSTFIVGLLNALYAYRGIWKSPMDLALEAIDIERNVLHDCVGCQDQTLAAFGGFNCIEFHSVTNIVVHRVPLSAARLELFESHLMLLYTGIRRRASKVARRQVKKVGQNHDHLKRMRAMVAEGLNCLTGTGDLEQFGKLLDEGWRLKMQLDHGVANDAIMEYYKQGLKAGAFGGKLLGAGGGGFLLFFVPPDKRAKVRKSLAELQELPLKINSPGSQIIHA